MIDIFLFCLLSGVFLSITPVSWPILCTIAADRPKISSNDLCFYIISVFVFFTSFGLIYLFLHDLLEYNLIAICFVCFVIYLLFFMGLNFSGYSNYISFICSRFNGLFVSCTSVVLLSPFFDRCIGVFTDHGLFFYFLVCLCVCIGFILCYCCFYFFDFKIESGFVHLKPLSAFIYYLYASFLVYVLVDRCGAWILLPILFGLIIFSIGLYSSSLEKHILFLFISVLPILYIVYYDHFNSLQTYKFNQKRLDALIEDGAKVLVVVKADWCTTCQNNKNFVLDTYSFKQLIKSTGVVYMVADLTFENTESMIYFSSLDRPGIPQNVLYKPYGEVVYLPSILSISILESSLK